jgi:hypothetical protein
MMELQGNETESGPHCSGQQELESDEKCFWDKAHLEDRLFAQPPASLGKGSNVEI